jgi:hypothetical protein
LPQPPSPYGIVNRAAVNVRLGPAEYYPIIAQLPYGEPVLLLGRNAAGAWYYVQMRDGRLGWMAASLLTVSPGLTLPVVATPPLPPTPTPIVWPTPVIWPTWTPLPPLPPTSTFTPGPPPTSTFTPAPAPPTWTPTPAPPPCPIAIGAPFQRVWAGDVRATMGCPADAMRETWTAVEWFERGVMFWREDQKMIYVLANDGTWRKIADVWSEGMPEYSCAATPPAGLVQPKRGFGYAWCNQPGLSTLVGWALADEHGYTTQYQSFAGGEMLRGEDNSIFALYRSGWWRRIP